MWVTREILNGYGEVSSTAELVVGSEEAIAQLFEGFGMCASRVTFDYNGGSIRWTRN